MRDTLPLLQAIPFPALHRAPLTTLQVNLGYLCNMTCVHCHVNAGPKRTEIMTPATADAILAFLDNNPNIEMLDLTGGAPEMCPEFRRIVTHARAKGVTVVDRCNLSILLQPGYEDLATFLADNQVEIVASLPCYLEDNVDAQRGDGAFADSIKGLQLLNSLGYGQDNGLSLNLVYNPQGASLPPEQTGLEAAYKEHLKEHFGIVFNSLFAIANMPIQRFGSMLVSKGEFEPYMETLQGAHQDANLPGVMCRSLISVDWQGYVYDCDFNQMLALPLAGKRTHISEIKGSLEGDAITVAGHCFGCTAGQGSSCGGAL